MKQATAVAENTSDYVKGEIARREAIHKKDVADFIRHEHSVYYQKALDSSLAYDDLALHDERDLEKVSGLFTLLPPSYSCCCSSRLQPFEEQLFPGWKPYSSPIYEP